MSRWRWQLLSRKRTMAPHSSTLAWKIPWTEEPGGLQSMGSLRVGHNWATSLWLFTFMHWRRKWQLLQCSCLENPGDGGAWWAAVYGVAQSWTRLTRLSSSSSSSLWNGLPGGTVVKNLPASAGDTRDTGSTPGLGRSPEVAKMATQSNILAWKIPWIEEPGGLLSMGSESDTTERLSTHTAQPPMEQCIQTTRQP